MNKLILDLLRLTSLIERFIAVKVILYCFGYVIIDGHTYWNGYPRDILFVFCAIAVFELRIPVIYKATVKRYVNKKLNAIAETEQAKKAEAEKAKRLAEKKEAAEASMAQAKSLLKAKS